MFSLPMPLAVRLLLEHLHLLPIWWLKMIENRNNSTLICTSWRLLTLKILRQLQIACREAFVREKYDTIILLESLHEWVELKLKYSIVFRSSVFVFVFLRLDSMGLPMAIRLKLQFECWFQSYIWKYLLASKNQLDLMLSKVHSSKTFWSEYCKR
jgi:hypothetical protein